MLREQKVLQQLREQHLILREQYEQYTQTYEQSSIDGEHHIFCIFKEEDVIFREQHHLKREPHILFKRTTSTISTEI